MKALVGAFNQEKALVGAFSVIVQPVVEPMDSFTALQFSPYFFLSASPPLPPPLSPSHSSPDPEELLDEEDEDDLLGDVELDFPCKLFSNN